MSKEIFEVNRVYGEEDFEVLMRKIINLKLSLQKTSSEKLPADVLSTTGEHI